MEYSFSQTFGRNPINTHLSSSIDLHGQILCQKMFNQDNNQQNIQNHHNTLQKSKYIRKNNINYCHKADRRSGSYVSSNKTQGKQNNIHNNYQYYKQQVSTPQFVKQQSKNMRQSQNTRKQHPKQDLSDKVLRLLNQLRLQNSDTKYSEIKRSKTVKTLGNKYKYNENSSFKQKQQTSKITRTASHSNILHKHTNKYSKNNLVKSYNNTEHRPNYKDQFNQFNKYDSRSYLQNIKKNDQSKFSILSSIQTINTSIATNKSNTKFFQKQYTQNQQDFLHEKLKKKAQKNSDKIIRTIESQLSGDQIFDPKQQSSIAEFRQEGHTKVQCDEIIKEENRSSFNQKISKISKKIDDYQRKINGSLHNKGNFNKKVSYRQRISQQNSLRIQNYHKKTEQIQKRTTFEIYQQPLNNNTIQNAHNSSTLFSFQESFPIKSQRDQDQEIRQYTPKYQNQKIQDIIKLKKSNVSKIGIHIMSQLSIDQQFRKSKKQFAKIPQDYVFTLSGAQINKWQILRQELIKKLSKFNECNLFDELFERYNGSLQQQFKKLEQLFQLKDDEADPFYSITIEDNQKQLKQIINNVCNLFISSQKNYRSNILRNFSQEQFSQLLNLMKNTTIALDQFTVALNQLTRSNYKCRDTYLFYCRLKGEDMILSRVHLQGKMIHESAY